jgi:hypothetical protein
MVARERLYRLIDELPERDLPAAEQLLVSLRDDTCDDFQRFLDAAPLDDEPTSPDEDAGAAEAKAQYHRGETISADEAKRLLLS